jgi:parvulin-like peptidyl-prolyl isomerase
MDKSVINNILKRTDMIKASHILVEHKQQAEVIKQILENGSDFATIAFICSRCPSGLQSGGDLGEFDKGQMVPEFDEVAHNMEVDTISDIVQTSFGFHIIKRTA